MDTYTNFVRRTNIIVGWHKYVHRIYDKDEYYYGNHFFLRYEMTTMGDFNQCCEEEQCTSFNSTMDGLKS